MELINALGLNWLTLVSQLINFAILYWLLKKFALDKIIKLMEQRQQDIDTGLKNAQLAEQALNQARGQQEEIILAARHEAKQIIAEGKKLGAAQEQQIIAQAKAQAQSIITTGHQQVELDKNKMLLEVQEQLAQIVSLGVQKVIEETVTPEQINQKYLEVGLKA